MKRIISLVAAIVLGFAIVSSPLGADMPNTIYFDDSDPSVMVLGNSAYYEIGLRRSNGSIAYIKDKTTEQQVSLGSRYECLWGLSSPNATPNYVGGCNYNAAWPNRFTYAWAAPNTLTLDYTPDPAASQRVMAQVVLTASDEPWFDMRLSLQNNWGFVLDYALFPSDLVFSEADIQEALVPILPGVVFEPTFFQQHQSYTAKYPGYPGLFADYFSIRSSKGQIAIYSLYDQGPIRPVTLGFLHDDAYVVGSTYSYHTFGARIGNGGSWDSPRIRVRVSQSAPDTIRAYRTDNGMDKFRSLTEKLGSRYAPITQSPLYKVDVPTFGQPFMQYPTLLSQLPSPGIFHLVAFQPGGHDENYPDFLPPADAWGTTADFAAMFQQAHTRGLFVMPYTNPTWWDDDSSTLLNLPPPLTIKDIAVLDDQGTALYEYYGPHVGYVISPYPPFVQQRLAQLMQQMTTAVPSDLIFEDQIGARPWLFDHNASSPSPTAYMDGWLAHTRTFSNTLLMTELGFDRLTETEVGFHGSVLLPERFELTPGWWGTATWHAYPLATMMARDKALFYQHDLAPDTMTVDKATLTWNLAFGYMLSYDVSTGVNDPLWLSWLGALQKYILARYASENITQFANLTSQVTRTSFETVTVIGNWDGANSYSTDGYTLAPQGVIVKSNGGLFTAGVFTTYNNAPLSAGDHYLIEERAGNTITVRQPKGADTSLTLRLPVGWSANDPIDGKAFTAGGQLIENVPLTITAESITFEYQQQRTGHPAAYYTIIDPAINAAHINLPLVVR